jgi:hypothetical protein
MRIAILSFLLAGFALCSSGASDANLLALAPANTQIVIGIDGAAIRSSQFGQYLIGQSEAREAGMQKFIEQTGIDPRRNVDFVLIAVHPDQKNAAGLVLVRGSFDEQRMKARAKAEGSIVETYNGVEILREKHQTTGPAAAFPQPGVLLIGDSASIRATISGRSNPGVLDPTLTRIIDQVSIDNDVWLAALTPKIDISPVAISPDIPPQLNSPQLFQSIQHVSGGLRLGDSAKLTLNVETRSPQDAGAVADVMRFAAGMLETQAQNNAQAAILAPALQNMLLSTSGADVHVVLSVPEKSLEQFAQISRAAGPVSFDGAVKAW